MIFFSISKACLCYAFISVNIYRNFTLDNCKLFSSIFKAWAKTKLHTLNKKIFTLFFLYAIDKRFYAFCFSHLHWLIISFWKLICYWVEIACSFYCFQKFCFLTSICDYIFQSFYDYWHWKYFLTWGPLLRIYL